MHYPGGPEIASKACSGSFLSLSIQAQAVAKGTVSRVSGQSLDLQPMESRHSRTMELEVEREKGLQARGQLST